MSQPNRTQQQQYGMINAFHKVKKQVQKIVLRFKHLFIWGKKIRQCKVLQTTFIIQTETLISIFLYLLKMVKQKAPDFKAIS